MLVAFRTDASFEMGSGHLMRCLTLADELVRRGHECVFAVRCQPGDHSQIIKDSGHGLLLLPRINEECESGPGPAHAHWLRGGTDRDVKDFIGALEKRRPQWLVVDHYGIDSSWEQKARQYCERVMIIDDLADREHLCDVLLDQNLGKSKSDYAALVPKNSVVLCGPHFALLRREFNRCRENSLRRKLSVRGNRLLINFGGVDQNNVTGSVLGALAQCPGAADLKITVVMGANAPRLGEVEAQLGQMNLNVELLTGVSNMAEVMANADMAIGAAGATSWERCCLGLPTLLLVIAENQRTVAEALCHNGAALGIFDLKQVPTQLCESLSRLSAQRASLTRHSSRLCDGRGSVRVADQLNEDNCG